LQGLWRGRKRGGGRGRNPGRGGPLREGRDANGSQWHFWPSAQKVINRQKWRGKRKAESEKREKARPHRSDYMSFANKNPSDETFGKGLRKIGMERENLEIVNNFWRLMVFFGKIVVFLQLETK
jgi:hypothetical protein